MKEYRHENVHCTIISIRRRRHISIIRIVVSKDARIVKRRRSEKERIAETEHTCQGADTIEGQRMHRRRQRRQDRTQQHDEEE